MISRCDGYSEEILTKNTIILYVPQFYADRFFLNNAQLKVRYFGKEKLKIRVPREYVDITDDYYYSRNVRYRLSNNRFSWEEKKGRLRQIIFTQKFQLSTIESLGSRECGLLLSVCMIQFTRILVMITAFWNAAPVYW